MIFPETVWRIHKRDHTVYLTFDDGPIPEVTPWVLDTLDRYGIKATFFMVGENAHRYPELLEEVRRRGHAVGPSQPRDRTRVSCVFCIAGGFFTTEPPGKPPMVRTQS